MKKVAAGKTTGQMTFRVARLKIVVRFLLRGENNDA